MPPESSSSNVVPLCAVVASSHSECSIGTVPWVGPGGSPPTDSTSRLDTRQPTIDRTSPVRPSQHRTLVDCRSSRPTAIPASTSGRADAAG